MKLAIVSHKECIKDRTRENHYLTDGGFPLQVRAISELFTETRLVVPCRTDVTSDGMAPLEGRQITTVPLSRLDGKNLSRKLRFPGWLLRNALVIWNEVRLADAVHAPIPGDIGTLGMVFALMQRKPLFVRHCGNWMVQKTIAEKFWKWSMEKFAGGRNVMLATGGSTSPPSSKNAEVKWIFSTSLSKNQLQNMTPKTLPAGGPIRLIIACRQEANKGTDVVIKSLPAILEMVPSAVLDVVGGGSLIPELKLLALSLGVESKVNFHGKVSQAEVLNLLGTAHIFCYPTTASEGFPKVVLEALANGLPVVTTNVSVLPILIGKGCGTLIEPTPDGLASAVSGIVNDAKRYEEMSAVALAVASEFTLEKWRAQIADNLRNAWNPGFEVSQPEVIGGTGSAL